MESRLHGGERIFKEFIGRDAEEVYAKVFGGKIVGGVRDGGKDVSTNDPEIPIVQVKSSIDGAKVSVKKSVEFKRFIPIVVGEPGSREEMIESLKKFGAWIGYNIPDRDFYLTAIAKARNMCYQ